MAFSHVDLALTTGLNDGTDWTNAYQATAGLVTAAAAGAAGDTVYVKNSFSEGVVRVIKGPTPISASLNPLLITGVKSATTNTGSSIVQFDLIPGIRTGDSTRAYDQVSGNAPPVVTTTTNGTTAIAGNVHVYGLKIVSDKSILISNDFNHNFITLEECHLEVTGATDIISLGTTVAVVFRLKLDHCKIDATAGNIKFVEHMKLEARDCIISGTDAGVIIGANYFGIAKIYSSDLSGCSASGIFDITSWRNGEAELWNCEMPASHTLVSGTAAGLYTVSNYGSEDNTGLDSADSEQALETRTNEGTGDIETTVVRTGGADDEATDSGGLFSWAIVANNVSENVVGVVSPWMEKWVLGDGTAKTATCFLTNSHPSAAGNNVEDDELYWEVQCPGEDGSSMYTSWPDEGAPGDGGGKMQLLGTAADIADDTGSVWAVGGENDQKLTQSIAPDYRGLVRARTHWSGNRGSLAYDAEVAPFAVGEVLTGAGGATGLITSVTDDGSTGTIYMRSVTGTFVNDEQITDSATGDATVNGTLTVMTLFVDPAMTVA